MKILLLGEFSAVHKNLKEALIQLGHEVVVASSGDGWKDIPSDILWPEGGKGLFSKLLVGAQLINTSLKMRGYDVVQIVHPTVFPHINNHLVRQVIAQNDKIFLLGAGADSVTAPSLKKSFKYPGFYEGMCANSAGIFYPERPEVVKYHNSLLDEINGYIPLMYEYAQGYRDIRYDKLCPTVPIPMNIDSIEYRENRPGRKVVFFHGISRDEEKGTQLIRDAMENLRKRYPNDVEIHLDGKMPLSDYLKLLDRVNVVIDQALCVSYGVNAVYSMAMGKVVVGGGDNAECKTEFGVKSCPMINVEPTVQDIERKLEDILERRNEIVDIGFESRQYVERVHDYITIATKYTNLWQRW